jgi:hypothetical protein
VIWLLLVLPLIYRNYSVMEKKYQVFVSSTYKDLTQERQEVMQALLELDCIPVGMELFPAADDDQWTLIKNLIDDCDYYILIIGGRYGSLSPSGVSYTQMEYEYALLKEIPIISFLHKNPDSISIAKSDFDPAFRDKLQKFKLLAEQKLVRYWETPGDLGSMVSRSLMKLIKTKPRPGWVKAIYLPSEDTANQILELKTLVERLTVELEEVSSKIPKGTEELSQGDDIIQISYTVTAKIDYELTNSARWDDYDVILTKETPLTWNEIFADIGPNLLNECTEKAMRDDINNLIKRKNSSDIFNELANQARYPDNFAIIDSDFHTVKIQLRALQLIKESPKRRSIKDMKPYWTLTSYGDAVMNRLRAVKKVQVIKLT